MTALNKPISKPWLWRQFPLQGRTGSDIFERLFRNDPIATLLESPPPWHTPLNRYSICAGQPDTSNGRLRLWTPSLGQVFPFLKQLLQQPLKSPPPSQELPFTGGWLGWLGYELAWEIERLPSPKPDPLPFPVAFWYEPACFAVLDHQQQQLWLAAKSTGALAKLTARLLASSPEWQLSPNPSPEILKFYTDRAAYEAAVVQAKQYIQAGDIFQANLSVRFSTRTAQDPWNLYRTLTCVNPSPFASYWRSPWGTVVSCSPERLVCLNHNLAQTRPIAGTRPRGSVFLQDQQLAHELLISPKEQAEHIMLVDLERNDLGRVCTWGSVRVDELLTLERYSHVMHLVSNISGTLRFECDAVDLIQALFPGGTITGCPKVRCLEIISELEPWSRNLFYGSCGYLDQRGYLDLNILIRTLLIPAQSESSPYVWGQVGAGIVADSHPTQEWQECLQKARAQLSALGWTQKTS